MIGTPEEISRYLWNLDKEKLYEIKEHRKKKSKSQNAYAWELITKIGNKMGLSKEEVYFNMLIHYGQSEVISMLSSINPIGYFKYYKEIGKTFLQGKEFTHYKIYKGSSEFNSEEMRILIDGIIQECKNLDIETLTPKEISMMRII